MKNAQKQERKSRNGRPIELARAFTTRVVPNKYKERLEQLKSQQD